VIAYILLRLVPTLLHRYYTAKYEVSMVVYIIVSLLHDAWFCEC